MPGRWHLGPGSSGQHSPCTVPCPSGKASWLQRTPGAPCPWNGEKTAFSLARTMAKALPEGRGPPTLAPHPDQTACKPLEGDVGPACANHVLFPVVLKR